MLQRVGVRLLFMALVGCGAGAGPAVMEYVEVTPQQPKIGEIATVRFRLFDNRGLPLAGQPVDFKLQSPNGAVTLSPATSSSQKGSGIVEVQLQASSRVNSVIVVATSGDRTVNTPPITFAGAFPNQGQFTFQCGPISGTSSGGRHAIGAYDETRNLIAGVKLNCTAHVGDRNGDGVVGALVSFLTEAGTIGPTEISQTNVVGDATILYKTSLPLPIDVDPGNFTWTPPSDNANTGEYLAPLWMHPYEWVPNPAINPPPPPGMNPREPSRLEQIPNRRKPDGAMIRMNPRDNLVSMIAVTSGEETFSDLNNNGLWDNGEPFEDLTEPFVDSNDDGTWNDGERYIDVNGDKVWNGKNMRYDANTLIWRQERLLWTGVPTSWDVQNPSPVISAFNPPGPFVFTCPTPMGSTSCTQAVASAPDPGGVAFHRTTIRVSDPWYNSIAQNAEGDGCAVGAAAGVGNPGGPPVVVQTLGAGTGSGGGGVAFTYPAGRSLILTIIDARNPNVPPDSQVPKRAPPLQFTVPVTCEFTASPEQGHVVRFIAGFVSGSIE